MNMLNSIAYDTNLPRIDSQFASRSGVIFGNGDDPGLVPREAPAFWRPVQLDNRPVCEFFAPVAASRASSPSYNDEPKFWFSC
jgi:hypothetical protein